LDTPGKDSYRYSEHGAKTVIAISANEIATIEKIPTETVPFRKILEKCRGNDIIILEEATQILAKKLEIPKIAVAKTQEEAQFISETCAPIIAFSGP
jgi:molybdopterin-guanine dinucleotide biosynthesis protein MobB